MAAHFVRTLRSTTNHFRFRSQTLQGASCLLCGNGPKTSRLHTYGVISRRQEVPRLCSTVTSRPFSSQVPKATQGVEETEEADELYKEVVVEVKGHDAAVLNSYEKFVTLAAGELDITVGRVFTPPKVITRWTQLKSVHIFKKHRVQYEARTLYKVFESKGTSIKEAIARWEEKQRQLNPDNPVKAVDAKVVLLCWQIPPVEKMDATLSTLTHCEHLSLSTNCIEKIANLNGLKHLKVLSLGRNYIRNLTGLVLYMSNNVVKDWNEFTKLADLPSLVELVFMGNPLEEKHSAEGDWTAQAIKRLPKLKKLDGVPVIHEEEE